jgi:hypothetical protein
VPTIAPDHELTDGQLAVPILWLVTAPLPRVVDVSDDVLDRAFGGGGRGQKLRSWGHSGDHGAHWLATRSGTALHTDTAYSRYTHHLILRNDGWRIRGMSDDLHPPMVPGAMYCLDTHSPHRVVPDQRVGVASEGGRPLYKVQVAVDTDDPLDPPTAWQWLTRKLVADEPGRTAGQAKSGAPRNP